MNSAAAAVGAALATVALLCRRFNSSRRPWLVLVAGEHWHTTTGKRWLGQHCSLAWVAKAYAQLVDGFGRDRVIVIGQLPQTLTWLERAAETGLPMFTGGLTSEESGRRWTARLAELRRDCERLLADGGCDYDGAACHPATVLDVLTGDAAAAGGPVVTGSGAVFAGLYSHGWSHNTVGGLKPSAAELAARRALEAAHPCDLCGRPHATATERAACPEHSSLSTREWFMCMEHEVPVERRASSGYGWSATSAHAHPHSLLYASQLVAALSRAFARRPERPVIMLHNYCGSAGMLKWMKRPSYRTHTGLARWPLAMMSSSGELEGAIPGLLPIYCRALADWLAAGAGALPAAATVGDLFAEVERLYMLATPSLDHVKVQSKQTEAPRCLLCTFTGSAATAWLCSCCHKEWVATEPCKRADLAVLKAEADAAAAAEEGVAVVEAAAPNDAGASAVKPTFCKLEACYGDEATPELRLADIFGQAR